MGDQGLDGEEAHVAALRAAGEPQGTRQRSLPLLFAPAPGMDRDHFVPATSLHVIEIAFDRHLLIGVLPRHGIVVVITANQQLAVDLRRLNPAG